MTVSNNNEREKEAQDIWDRSQKSYEDFRFQDSIELLLKLKNEYAEVFDECYINESLGKSYYYLGEYNLSLSYLNMAREQANPEKDKLCILISLHYAGICNLELEKYDEALKFYNEAEKFIYCYKGNKWKNSRMSYYLMFGRCNRELSNFEQALKYFREFENNLEYLTPAERIHDENLIWYEIAKTYYKMRDKEHASKFVERINLDEIFIFHRIELMLIKADLYIVDGNYERALTLTDEIELSEFNDIQLARLYNMKGVALYYLGNYKESELNLKKSLNTKNIPGWVKETNRNYLKAISEESLGGIIPKIVHRLFKTKD